MVIGLCKFDLTFFIEEKDDITLLDVRLPGQHWKFQYQFLETPNTVSALSIIQTTKNSLNKKIHCNTVSAMGI